MDPQPHPLLQFLVRMKPTSTNVFLQVAKTVEVTRERSGVYGGCWSVSQPNLSLSLTRLAVWGWALSCKRIIPFDSIPGRFDLWRVAASSATKKRTTPLCYSLLAFISNAGRTHFTQRSPPEQWRNNRVDLCVFTMQMAVSIHNKSVANFCEECVLWRVFGFHLTAPHTCECSVANKAWQQPYATALDNDLYRSKRVEQ